MRLISIIDGNNAKAAPSPEHIRPAAPERDTYKHPSDFIIYTATDYCAIMCSYKTRTVIMVFKSAR